MKKMLAILLAAAMAFGLCACGGGGAAADPGKESTQAPTTEPQPVVMDIDVGGVTTIGQVAELQIVNAYATKDVMPPKPDSVYTHYEASAGNTYFVIVMDIKNIGGGAVSASSIISAALAVGEVAYTPVVLVETEDGASLDSGSSTSIDALATARVYHLYSVPEGSDTSNLTMTVLDGDVGYVGTFSMSDFEAKIQTLSAGSVVTDDATISLTVDSVEFKNSLYPPRATGYYHYYEADSGKIYLIVKMTVKNLKGTDMKYDSIAGLSCVYNEKYNYSFFTVLEEDGGEDLNGYPSQYAIAPLDQGVVYYLAEVPAEVQNGPVVVTLYIAGSYYKIVI